MRGAGAREGASLGFVFVFAVVVVIILFIVVVNGQESVVVVVAVVLDLHLSATLYLPHSPSTNLPSPVNVSKGVPNTDIWGGAFVRGKTERAVVFANPTRSALADNGADTADNYKRNNNNGNSGTPMRAPPPLPNISSTHPPTATLPSLQGPYRLYHFFLPWIC